MQRKSIFITAAVTAVLTTATVVGLGSWGVHNAFAAGPWMQNQAMSNAGQFMPQHNRQMAMMGDGYGMPGKHAGFGRHGGFAKNGMGGCAQNQALDTPLTVDTVRTHLEQMLEWRGNDRLKVGSVTDKDDKTIVAEIVTVDDSLVKKIEIDKETGRRTPVK